MMGKDVEEILRDWCRDGTTWDGNPVHLSELSVFVSLLLRRLDMARAAALLPLMENAVYVASRASVPARPAMWKEMRLRGWGITSSWIDEAGPGETPSMTELWGTRIPDEVARAKGVVLYVEEEDLPLKGAFVEIGMALILGRPVRYVAPDIDDPKKLLGSWILHPKVERRETVEDALMDLLGPPQESFTPPY